MPPASTRVSPYLPGASVRFEPPLTSIAGSGENFTVASGGTTALMGMFVLTVPLRLALEGAIRAPPAVREPLTVTPSPNVTLALLSRLPTFAPSPRNVFASPRFDTSPNALTPFALLLVLTDERGPITSAPFAERPNSVARLGRGRTSWNSSAKHFSRGASGAVAQQPFACTSV